MLLVTSLVSLLFIDLPMSEIESESAHNNLQQMPEVVPTQQQLQQPLFDTTTLSASPIDPTMSDRLTWETEDKCDRVLLYMPYFFAGHGQGFQINCYLMAAVMAAYMNMALVIFEPPRNGNRFDTGSQVSWTHRTSVVSFALL